MVTFRVFFENFDEHPRQLYMEVPPPPGTHHRIHENNLLSLLDVSGGVQGVTIDIPSRMTQQDVTSHHRMEPKPIVELHTF